MTSLQIQAEQARIAQQQANTAARQADTAYGELQRKKAADEVAKQQGWSKESRSWVEYFSKLFMPDASVGPFKKDQW